MHPYSSWPISVTCLDEISQSVLNDSLNNNIFTFATVFSYITLCWAMCVYHLIATFSGKQRSQLRHSIWFNLYCTLKPESNPSFSGPQEFCAAPKMALSCQGLFLNLHPIEKKKIHRYLIVHFHSNLMQFWKVWPRVATIRMSHGSIHITIQTLRYDTYHDTWKYLRRKNKWTVLPILMPFSNTFPL